MLSAFSRGPFLAGAARLRLPVEEEEEEEEEEAEEDRRGEE
jgi:hypothetical protein